MINDWDSEFVAVELLDSIGPVSVPSAEDVRNGFGMDDSDNDETSAAEAFTSADETSADLPLTSSGIIDTNIMERY